MRSRAARLSSTLLLILSAATARAYDFAALDSIMTATPWGANGATLVVQRDTTTVYQRSVLPMTPTRQILIASSSKWMSAAAFMTLVDAGQVSLDDHVSTYLPLFTGVKGSMTIRQLWSHTSGLPSNSPYATDTSLTLAQCVDSIALRTPLQNAPGTAFVYGQTSMQVAGRIAEVVSGRSWADFFHDRIAAPLGMNDTFYGGGSNPLIAGGARSTARDYARFVAMLSQGGHLGNAHVLSPQAVATMQRDQTNGARIVSSPYGGFPGLENTRYGVGEWLTAQDPYSDRAFVVSSQGAFGFSPWVSACTGASGLIATVGDLAVVTPAFFRAISIVSREIPDSCIAARLDAPPARADGALRLAVSGGNPARGALVLRWSQPAVAEARLELFDLRGARVATLAHGPSAAGEHDVRWSPPSSLPAGVYLARLRAGAETATARVAWVR